MLHQTSSFQNQFFKYTFKCLSWFIKLSIYFFLRWFKKDGFLNSVIIYIHFYLHPLAGADLDMALNTEWFKVQYTCTHVIWTLYSIINVAILQKIVDRSPVVTWQRDFTPQNFKIILPRQMKTDQKRHKELLCEGKFTWQFSQG